MLPTLTSLPSILPSAASITICLLLKALPQLPIVFRVKRIVFDLPGLAQRGPYPLPSPFSPLASQLLLASPSCSRPSALCFPHHEDFLGLIFVSDCNHLLSLLCRHTSFLSFSSQFKCDFLREAFCNSCYLAHAPVGGFYLFAGLVS